jgi:phenylacetate-CoA ligase
MSERRIQDARFELASPDAIRAVQLRKLGALVRFVQATNPFFREHWRKGGVDLDRDTASLEAFAAGVPWVEKADFVADQAAHPPYGRRFEHPLSLGERLDFYTTSGTSGQGTEAHAQTVRELREMERVYAYGFRWAGLAPGDGVALTLPITMLAGGRVELQGATGAGMTVYPLGNYDAHRKLELIRQLKPRALYGSTTYFGHLAAIAEDEPFDSIDTLLCGLEGVGLSYFAQLQERFGARAYDRFGCAQMRSDFMFNCEHGVGSADSPGILHNVDPYVLLEVVDPETGRHVADGEFGELVVTSLYHLDNPLVRCRLKDGGIYRAPGSCSCGRPFGGVEVASISRMDDVKKIKGVNIYPQAVDDLLYSFGEVEEYRVLLRSVAGADVATVEVMTKAPLAEEAREGFARAIAGGLRERVGIGFGVELHDELPRSEYKARRWHDEREGR